MYTPCVLNNNMCVYANHFNLLHCSTVQVIIESKYMIFVADIVVNIDYLSSLVAHICCVYACSLNELNLLLYSSVISPYLCNMLVICTCMMCVTSAKYIVRQSTPSYVFTSLLYNVRMFTHTIMIELIIKKKAEYQS